MNNDLWKLTAVEAVTLLKKREISPLDLVEASARRIAEVEPTVNALPTSASSSPRGETRGRAVKGEGGGGTGAQLREREGMSSRLGGPDLGPHLLPAPVSKANTAM